jgi:hypothetical protein
MMNLSIDAAVGDAVVVAAAEVEGPMLEWLSDFGKRAMNQRLRKRLQQLLEAMNMTSSRCPMKILTNNDVLLHRPSLELNIKQ